MNAVLGSGIPYTVCCSFELEEEMTESLMKRGQW